MFGLTDIDCKLLQGMDIMPKGIMFPNNFFVDILVNSDGSSTEFEVRYKGVLIKRFDKLSDVFEFVLQ